MVVPAAYFVSMESFEFERPGDDLKATRQSSMGKIYFDVVLLSIFRYLLR